jgi:hypothetical protein
MQLANHTVKICIYLHTPKKKPYQEVAQRSLQILRGRLGSALELPETLLWSAVLANRNAKSVKFATRLTSLTFRIDLGEIFFSPDCLEWIEASRTSLVAISVLQSHV